jgi:hypothetical protein
MMKKMMIDREAERKGEKNMIYIIYIYIYIYI